MRESLRQWMMYEVRSGLPTGTVTFLFTDVEGSTRLLDDLGGDRYGALLAEHHRVCRESWAAHGGVEVGTSGDAFFVVFAQASDALAAAAAAQSGLASLGVAVRMGMHTGEGSVTQTGYVGIDVHRAARIAAAGCGGQVLVSATTAALVETPLTDLGEHRFKDLRAAERVYQLGEDRFPPLKSLYRTNLPVPATSFLGRELELDALSALLHEPGTRLVTVTGAGGTGKTRLALQAVAAAFDGFPGGVFWVSLAPLRDPHLLLTEVAMATGVEEGEGSSPLEDLARGLAGRRLLILVDNAEHLLPEAAEHVSVLVAACPTVTVVVTSRERLQIPGERVYAVSPMSEADGEALFLRCAADAGIPLDGSDELRVLCARLDNLPLAIELAAARMAVFSPAQLVERLAERLDVLKGRRGVDERQETLRATIEWSHELLAADEQQVFRRLSVFAASCTYQSAEQVAGADPDTLQSLLDKSLLRRRDGSSGPRFWMLETIREYAGEQLVVAGEADALRSRHLDHYAGIAAESFDETWSGRDNIARLDEERDNLRVALDHALSTSAEAALTLGADLSRLWYWLGGARGGREKISAALAIAGERFGSARARALWASASLAEAGGDLSGAEASCLEALVLLRALDDRVGEGRALMTLGWIAFLRADPREARRYYGDALAALDTPGGEVSSRRVRSYLAVLLATEGDHGAALELQRRVVETERREGSDFLLGTYLHHLGEMERAAGQVEAARRSLAEAVTLMRRAGFKRMLAYSLHSLGCALRAFPVGAVAAFSESLELARELDSSYLVAACLEGAAGVFADVGDAEHATSLLGAASAIRSRVGTSPTEKADADSVELQCREALTADAFVAARQRGAAVDGDAVVEWALDTWERSGETLSHS